MSVTSSNSGTQTATIDTEHTLDTITSAGIYVLVVDMANLTTGDIVTLKAKVKYASGGTSRLAYQATYAHDQAEPIKFSPPVPIDTEVVFTLEQTDGTGRSFPWNILKVA